jgi:hypothetical protein
MQIWGGYPAGRRNIYSVDSDKNVTFPANVSAPIYYDSDNTGFNIDLSSTGQAIRARGYMYLGSNSSGKYLRIGGDGGTSSFGNLTVTNGNLHMDAENAFTMYLNHYSNANVYVGNGGGFLQAYYSLRAPIFYDSDNTGYYVDPSGGSKLFDLNIEGTGNKYLYIYSTSGNEAMVRYIGGSGNSWYVGKRTTTQLVGTESFHFYSEAAGATVAGIDTAGNIFSTGSVRSPVFYDSNNTGYYADPASTSNLNRLIITARNDNYNVGSLNTTDAVSDWQSLTNTNGQFTVSQFNNFTNGSFSNHPTGVYQYGAVLSWRTANHSFQLYASHTGDLSYKTQWGNDNYSGWLTPVVYGRNGGTSSGKTIYGSVYYDTDNTAYFTDPASRSRQATIDFGDSSYYIGAGSWGMRNNTPYGYIEFGPANASHAHIYTDRSNFYFNAQVQVLGGSQINQNDIRSAVFYDQNDTGYYVDPNSTTKNANFRSYVEFADYGAGIVGTYASTRFQLVYAMGNAYKGALDGTSVSGGYGLWYSHPNAGGVAANLSNHGLMNIVNGSWHASLASSTRAVSDMRTPIYYDLDNTGYYTDPNGYSSVWRLNVQANFNSDTAGSTIYIGGQNVSTSNSLWINFHSDADVNYRIGKPAGAWTQPLEIRFYTGIRYKAHSTYGGHQFSNMSDGSLYFDVGNNAALTRSLVNFHAPIMYDYNNTNYYVDPASSSVLNADLTTDQYYARGWFRNNSSGNGLYNQATGQHFYSDEASGWNIAGNSVNSWLRFRDSYGGTIRGYLHATTNNDIGFLNQAGNWRARVVSGDYFLIEGSSARAPIFYDSNNTSYYADPASESVFNTVTFFGELNLSATGQTYVDHTGTIIFRNQSGYAASASLTTGGDFTTAANITAYGSPSDINLKENIENIPNALEKLLTLNGVNFNYKKDGSRSTGVIAQEVEKVLPEVVYEATNVEGDEQFKAVRYGNMVGLLIEAIKEQQTLINNMQDQINSLKRG